VKGSHAIPDYGFERIGDPPPLLVNLGRLIAEFETGRENNTATWAQALSPDVLESVMELPADGEFNFPDDLWARVVYDTAIAYHAGKAPIDELVAALVPLYFGRVASLITEAEHLSTDEAETLVERQARAFEAAKSYLVGRWRSTVPAVNSAATAAKA